MFHPPQLNPASLLHLSPSDLLFLPHLTGEWKLFSLQEKLPSGILVRSLRERETRLLSPQQNVIRCQASAQWLDFWGDLLMPFLWLPTTGSSMQPWLQAGDQAAVAPCSWRDVRIGQVIVFAVGTRWWVHRVVSLSPDPPSRLQSALRAWQRIAHHSQSSEETEPTQWKCWTRGDNRLELDPPLQSHHILGRVIQAKRGETPLPFDTPPQRMYNALRETKRLLKHP